MRAFGLIVVIGLLNAACTTVGNDVTTTTGAIASTSTVQQASSTTTATTAAVTAPTTSASTSLTTTTVAAPTASTTTAAPDIRYTAPQPLTLKPPEPIAGSDGATGSGCAPGTAQLPDGVWFGFVSDVVRGSEQSVAFDLACFWFGDIAWEVAAAEGDEANGDFYITNDNPALRMAPVGPDAVVWTIAGDPTEGHSVVPFDDWPSEEQSYVPCPGDWCGVWLYVNGGLVTEIVEQYIP